MNVSDILTHCPRPKAILNNVRFMLDKNDEFKEALIHDDFKKIEDILNRNTGLGHQAHGLIWAMIRETNEDVYGPLLGFDHIPNDFYAYNKISDPLDLSNENIKWIGYHAFYNSDLRKIYLPKTVQQINDRAFCQLRDHGGDLDIIYPGTKKEWRSIKKAANIFNDAYSEPRVEKVITCSDGDIY